MGASTGPETRWTHNPGKAHAHACTRLHQASRMWRHMRATCQQQMAPDSATPASPRQSRPRRNSREWCGWCASCGERAQWAMVRLPRRCHGRPYARRPRCQDWDAGWNAPTYRPYVPHVGSRSPTMMITVVIMGDRLMRTPIGLPEHAWRAAQRQHRPAGRLPVTSSNACMVCRQFQEFYYLYQ